MNFERIKPTRKHSKLDTVEFEKIKSNKKLKATLASEFESNKKVMRKKDKAKRDERKAKWDCEDELYEIGRASCRERV